MKIVLAYSGGLDTSICIKWLQEEYDADIVTLTLELGQEDENLKAVEKKAREIGAVSTYSLDVRKEFVENYIHQSIKANGMYEDIYPLSTALARPLISKKLVEIAEKENADAIAHGATGKGNDQVRFELAARALNPELKIIAPAREWDLSRESSVEYAKKHGIDVPVEKGSEYSVDENLWGKSIEAGPLEDPMTQSLEEIFSWTVNPEKAPDKGETVDIEFRKGVPVKINHTEKKPVELIQFINELGGKHGIGRIDTIEDRLVGIKSREIYECPGALLLLKAHRDLERLTLTREQNLFKEIIDSRWSQLVYFGQWHEPLKKDLDTFIENTQKHVNGTVRMKLYKGNASVVGRESKDSLYDLGLATYDEDDQFDHRLARGFVKLWGLPSETASKRDKD